MIDLSIVIPWGGEDYPLNIPKHRSTDEVLVMTGGENPGQARLEGAKRAENEWLVFTDGDGEYPLDYIENVRNAIEGNPNRRGFRTERSGGLGTIFNFEGGMVLKKDLLFERVRNFEQFLWFDDFGYKFWGLPVEESAPYYHPFTKGERGLLAGGLLSVIGVGLHLVDGLTESS